MAIDLTGGLGDSREHGLNAAELRQSIPTAEVFEESGKLHA